MCWLDDCLCACAFISASLLLDDDDDDDDADDKDERIGSVEVADEEAAVGRGGVDAAGGTMIVCTGRVKLYWAVVLTPVLLPILTWFVTISLHWPPLAADCGDASLTSVMFVVASFSLDIDCDLPCVGAVDVDNEVGVGCGCCIC